MSTRDSAWPGGTPNWVDLSVDDPGAAATFYTELFGWSIYDPGPDAGGYLLASKNDHSAAGIGPRPSPDVPPNWATYLASDDADATAAAVKAAGGSLHMDPFDVMDNGRMFFGTAPDGSTFGVWQAGSHLGAGIVNEAGGLAWNELHSHDLDAAKKFYGEVFGYEYDDLSGPESTYNIVKRAGEADGLAGMTNADQLPEGVPSVWLTWFGVDDCDAAAAKVASLGGTVRVPAYDTPFGRMAILGGAQGEVFGVIQLSQAAG